MSPDPINSPRRSTSIWTLVLLGIHLFCGMAIFLLNAERGKLATLFGASTLVATCSGLIAVYRPTRISLGVFSVLVLSEMVAYVVLAPARYEALLLAASCLAALAALTIVERQLRKASTIEELPLKSTTRCDVEAATAKANRAPGP